MGGDSAPSFAVINIPSSTSATSAESIADSQAPIFATNKPAYIGKKVPFAPLEASTSQRQESQSRISPKERTNRQSRCHHWKRDLLIIVAVALILAGVGVGVWRIIASNGNDSSGSDQTDQTTTQSNLPAKPRDCYDQLHRFQQIYDGLYTIFPDGSTSVRVYCDMTGASGGWTVFQRRSSSQVPFWQRTWDEYKNGFPSDLQVENVWLGLNWLHVLTTKDTNVEMRIEMSGPYNDSGKSTSGYWVGGWRFQVGAESTNYMLTISGGKLNGNATIVTDLSPLNNIRFSTVNNVNAADEDGFQASQIGGWWYNKNSINIALNGKYGTRFGFNWDRQNGGSAEWVYLTKSEMKLRRY